MMQMHYRSSTASAHPNEKSAYGLTLTSAASIIALSGTAPTHVLNGLNVIGFGAEVALARDTSVLNANPAGLVGIEPIDASQS
jgi:hypothetical protein